MGRKRSIIFFIDSLSGGGAERVCALLANSFSTRVNDITVVTIKESLPTDYQLAQNVNRISLLASKKSHTISGALKNNITLILNLRKLIKTKQPDFVISLMTQSNIVCSLACLLISTRHIASERIHPPLEKIGTQWNFLRKYLYRLPLAIVSQTDKTSAWLSENTNCKLSTVIPNPVTYPLQPTATQQNSKKLYSISKEQKIVLGVGRLVNQKQFDKLISAFSTIAPNYPNWILVIAGEGPNKTELQQQIDVLSLNSRVLLIGKQENMGYWYEQAEVFVLTSKFEGYPNALLEAMCYGVAPISYRCDTGPESIIQHQHNGILVPLDDEELLVSGIRNYIDNPNLRHEIGNNAKNIAQTHSIEVITTEWETLFERIIKVRS